MTDPQADPIAQAPNPISDTDQPVRPNCRLRNALSSRGVGRGTARASVAGHKNSRKVIRPPGDSATLAWPSETGCVGTRIALIDACPACSRSVIATHRCLKSRDRRSIMSGDSKHLDRRRAYWRECRRLGSPIVADAFRYAVLCVLENRRGANPPMGASRRRLSPSRLKSGQPSVCAQLVAGEAGQKRK